MAHGTRGRWLRVATTGFGVVLCTGLIGCMNSDKPKDTRAATKQPGPSLPGTPTLPPGGTGSALNRTPATPGSTFNGSGQPFNGNGSNLIQTGGTTPGTPAGAGFGAGRVGTDGRNTNTTGTAPTPGYMSAPVGAAGTINPPTPPSGFTPGPVGMGTPPASGNTAAYASASPDMPLLPPPPPSYPGRGQDLAGMSLQPPPSAYAPLAPPQTPPGAPPRGASVGGGTFGSGYPNP